MLIAFISAIKYAEDDASPEPWEKISEKKETLTGGHLKRLRHTLATSLCISETEEASSFFVYFITYLFTHILLVYIGIYHFKIILFFIYFVIGFIFDVYLLNEIGTHTVTFMVLILILGLL